MQSPETVSTKLERIAKLASQMVDTPLTSLSHHMDMAWMREAWKRTRKSGASGVDGVRARDYEADLEQNLQSLLDRAKSGRYFAPPVRRVEIPKGKGTETRPIGIPTLEDKVLQRAVAMALEAVYEQDFLPCSYGFRPGRDAHDALEAFWQGAMTMNGGWLVEVDIRRFFDTLDRSHLRTILRQRVRDGVLLRLIDKWLKAGVLEAGSIHYPEAGTPQGGVISPLLANIYLHTVLDLWITERVAPKLRGSVQVVRFADDVVLLFQLESDARRVYDALPTRFEQYGLKLHPSKTRMVEFRQPRYRDPKPPHVSFDFLGFTHYWGRSRKGGWIVKRKTAKDRLSRSLHAIRQWCRRHRHLPLAEQHRALCSKVRGHYNYYGLTGNGQRLRGFLREVQHAWQKWLNRRSRKANMYWARFERILKHYPLPPVRLPRSMYGP